MQFHTFALSLCSDWDADPVIVHCCPWQKCWAPEGSECSPLSEMLLFFQEKDKLVALGRRNSQVLLLILWEHFPLLFVIGGVDTLQFLAKIKLQFLF